MWREISRSEQKVLQIALDLSHLKQFEEQASVRPKTKKPIITKEWGRRTYRLRIGGTSGVMLTSNLYENYQSDQREGEKNKMRKGMY